MVMVISSRYGTAVGVADTYSVITEITVVGATSGEGCDFAEAAGA
jgi:hypothetical protein